MHDSHPQFGPSAGGSVTVTGASVGSATGRVVGTVVGLAVAKAVGLTVGRNEGLGVSSTGVSSSSPGRHCQ